MLTAGRSTAEAQCRRDHDDRHDLTHTSDTGDRLDGGGVERPWSNSGTLRSGRDLDRGDHGLFFETAEHLSTRSGRKREEGDQGRRGEDHADQRKAVPQWSATQTA